MSDMKYLVRFVGRQWCEGGDGTHCIGELEHAHSQDGWDQCGPDFTT